MSLMTKHDFQEMYHRHNFTQAQSGSFDAFNELLRQELDHLVRQSMLQAEHQGNSSLQKKHLLKVLEKSREVPRGVYHSNHLTGP